jgi:ppGpp synthetase/RelA/SpoT-type nucleotidyltranferase
VLNTFQTNLRRRATASNAIVAQRLKRRPTIIDKLKREPTMQLDTMHDIAGCRIIFDRENSLRNFRTSLQKSKANHKRRGKGDDRYDYIKSPKDSGYRGIHDIYTYQVHSDAGAKWNGLLVELQFSLENSSGVSGHGANR